MYRTSREVELKLSDESIDAADYHAHDEGANKNTQKHTYGTKDLPN